MGCGGSTPANDETTTGEGEIGKGGGGGGKGRKQSQTRRIAVRSDVVDDYDPTKDKTETIPKTDGEKDEIRLALSKSDLFGNVNSDDMEILIKRFQSVGVEIGEEVIKQGSDGDLFYIVSSGKYVASLSQQGNAIVAEYGEGESFGELALLYNAPRAASVTCKEGGRLWAIERKVFRYVVITKGAANLQERTDKFLKSISLLSPLSDAQRAALAEKLEVLDYGDQEYVCKKGDIADALFFIKKGELAVHMGDGKDDVARMKAGDVFGESCLEPTSDDATRKANIVAVGEVTVLKLTAAAFKEQIGSLSDVVADTFKRKVMSNVVIEGTRIFDELFPEDQDSLLSKLEERTYEPGQKLIEQGKPNEFFYLIKQGSANVVQEHAPGTSDGSRILATLKAGQFFGERALLKEEPASANIVCADGGSLVVYTLGRDDFNAIFGGQLQLLLDRAMKRREEEAARPDRPKFSDLELRRILGVGTFGRVKMVIHRPSSQTYALKCMRKAQVVATKQNSHILNEKNILAMMKHPFILALIQTYQDAGELYMLMEVALGGELFSLLAKRAPLFDSPARFFAASVASMFSYMHNLAVVYRDLKPENLLLDKQGYLKLVDFGFAKIITDRTWTLCGTPEYLAPEIILNKGHGFGADWWCLGILAYECLTGTTPFVSNDPMDGYRKIIKCKVPWPSQLTPYAKDFIDKLLCVDPTRRLGCLKGGARDVRAHSWFKVIDFKALEAKELPAPYVPKIKSVTDASNFDFYDQDEGKINYPEEDFPRDMFKDFAEDWVDGQQVEA